MITVLFFARIREQLGVDRLSLPLSDTGLTVAQLRQQLIAAHGGDWGKVLTANNIIKSVNQTVSDDTQVLVDGDEVAFFPPVTGG
jgi:molybdopterin converting factor subunit 1